MKRCCTCSSCCVHLSFGVFPGASWRKPYENMKERSREKSIIEDSDERSHSGYMGHPSRTLDEHSSMARTSVVNEWRSTKDREPNVIVAAEV